MAHYVVTRRDGRRFVTTSPARYQEDARYAVRPVRLTGWDEARGYTWAEVAS